ncbi:MAG: hypothetical protein LBN43_09960 [Oscillospiraceae bacterium]|nr:hypothetical protein [Oscillospiraceae bacterium]
MRFKLFSRFCRFSATAAISRRHIFAISPVAIPNALIVCGVLKLVTLRKTSAPKYLSASIPHRVISIYATLFLIAARYSALTLSSSISANALYSRKSSNSAR